MITATRHYPALDLAAALWWRARREGLRWFAIGFVPLLVVLAILVLSLGFKGHVNGNAAATAAFGRREGVAGSPLYVGLFLLVGPGMVALFGSLGVAQVVRGIVGQEATRGGLELALAGPYTPGSLARGLLLYVLGVAVLEWLGATVLAAAALLVVAHMLGSHLMLHAGYVGVALLVPLAAILSGSCIALVVYLRAPRLAQMGSFGLNFGGGGIGSLAGSVPGLAVVLVSVFLGTSVSPATLGIALGITACIVGIGAATVVAFRFNPDAVL